MAAGGCQIRGAIEAMVRLAWNSSDVEGGRAGSAVRPPGEPSCCTRQSSRSKFVVIRLFCSTSSAVVAARPADRPAKPSAAICLAACRTLVGVTVCSPAMRADNLMSWTVGLQRPRALLQGRM
jgi:hypothetical protein